MFLCAEQKHKALCAHTKTRQRTQGKEKSEHLPNECRIGIRPKDRRARWHGHLLPWKLRHRLVVFVGTTGGRTSPGDERHFKARCFSGRILLPFHLGSSSGESPGFSGRELRVKFEKSRGFCSLTHELEPDPSGQKHRVKKVSKNCTTQTPESRKEKKLIY